MFFVINELHFIFQANVIFCLIWHGHSNQCIEYHDIIKNIDKDKDSERMEHKIHNLNLSKK